MCSSVRYYKSIHVILVHYSDIIMSAMASQTTSLTIVYSMVYSGIDQIKHQSSMSLAFVRGIHQWPVNSPHKGPATQKMFPLMTSSCLTVFSCPCSIQTQHVPQDCHHEIFMPTYNLLNWNLLISCIIYATNILAITVILKEKWDHIRDSIIYSGVNWSKYFCDK